MATFVVVWREKWSWEGAVAVELVVLSLRSGKFAFDILGYCVWWDVHALELFRLALLCHVPRVVRGFGNTMTFRYFVVGHMKTGKCEDLVVLVSY